MLCAYTSQVLNPCMVTLMIQRDTEFKPYRPSMHNAVALFSQISASLYTLSLLSTFAPDTPQTSVRLRPLCKASTSPLHRSATMTVDNVDK
jgi:hypothetical protein